MVSLPPTSAAAPRAALGSPGPEPLGPPPAEPPVGHLASTRAERDPAAGRQLGATTPAAEYQSHARSVCSLHIAGALSLVIELCPGDDAAAGDKSADLPWSIGRAGPFARAWSRTDAWWPNPRPWLRRWSQALRAQRGRVVRAPGAGRRWCTGRSRLMFWRARIAWVGCGWSRRCTIPPWSGNSSRTWGWPAQGRAPGPAPPVPWSALRGRDGRRRACAASVVPAEPGGLFAAWRRRCARL